MTDDNTTPPTTGTVPDVAETNLPQRKSMSEDTDRKDRAYRQAVERKFEIERLQRDLKDRDDKIAALMKERDDAVKVADETKAAYEEFTNENTLQKRIGELERTIRYRDTMDMFNSIEGVEYHEGVTLDDLFSAAGVDFDSLDEIPEDFTTKVLEAAKAKKPYLFAVSGSAEPQKTGEVPQETAASAPALKAFGAQAAGGGAAPPGQKPTIDYSDPVAVMRHARTLQESGKS